jgi:ketosteroid isomerase-like protein
MASSVIAQEPDSSSALFQMRNAEQIFARGSVMHGRNAAFIENFADESVIFTDKWITNGKQFWQERKDSPVVLKWEPEFMDIAASGDFGISTGPWEMQEYRPNTAPVSTGYFLTVWKRQPGGNWQVILDAGSVTPARSGYDHKFSFPAGADKAVLNPGIFNPTSVSAELSGIEKQMLSTWKNNLVPATYISFLKPNARMQLNGHLPTTDRDTINKWIAQLEKTVTWRSTGSGASSSGDLGFTYGYLGKKGDPEKSEGHYVRIWRKQTDGKWAIILEMMSIDKF